jgi:hypothetical protein
MWNLVILGRLLQYQFVCGFFETFIVDGDLKGLSNKPLQARFGQFLHELWGFVFFVWNEGSLGRGLGHWRWRPVLPNRDGQMGVRKGLRVEDHGRGMVNPGLTMGGLQGGIWLGQLPTQVLQRPNSAAKSPPTLENEDVNADLTIGGLIHANKTSLHPKLERKFESQGVLNARLLNGL